VSEFFRQMEAIKRAETRINIKQLMSKKIGEDISEMDK